MTTNSERKINNAVRTASQSASTEKPLNLNNTSTNNQHKVIIEALAEGKKTSVWLKEARGILQPSARMAELRNQGYVIHVGKVEAVTSDGSKHKGVAEYTLVKRVKHD